MFHRTTTFVLDYTTPRALRTSAARLKGSADIRHRVLLCALALVLLTSCARAQNHTAVYADSFDTFTRVTVVCSSQDEAAALTRIAHDELTRLSALFDIYSNAGKGDNLKTVNENAGIAPVRCDPEILALVKQGVLWHGMTGGAVNIAAGPVLRLWHNAREALVPALPDPAALETARALCEIQDVVIDEAAGTVFLRKSGMSLDVGAIAKGYALERTARVLRDAGARDFLLNAGGDVLASGSPAGGRKSWGIGLEDPAGDPNAAAPSLIATLRASSVSVVTSGDYQRYFTVDGKRYCHIIDLETLMPSAPHRSVTVIAPSAIAADALSTALFILSEDEGRALLTRTGGDAVWVDGDGRITMTEGAKKLKP